MKKLLTCILFCATLLPCMSKDVDTTLVAQAGFPVLVIETVNGEWPTFKIAQKTDSSYIGNSITEAEKVPGRVYLKYKNEIIYDSHEYIKDSLGMTIKVRGNTSAYTDKRSYKIKLQKKADMLCRGVDSIYKDKNWILIKEKKLRNRVGFKINELAKLQWTPAFQYVNVIMNGSYEGIYILMESVKRNTKCRLDVSDTGYIAEYDPYFWNEDVFVWSNLNWITWLPMNYTFKYPDSEDITQEQIDYFATYIDKVEDSLHDGSYPDYIDVESFARWMIARDILGNSDGAGSNIFFTKYDNTPNSKIMMANLWDLDGIMKNENKWDEVHKKGIFYYFDLFEWSKNHDFRRMYKYIWNQEKDAIFDQMKNFLDEYPTSEEAIAMDKSIVLDNQRWNTDNDGVEVSIKNAKDWFTKRKKWLDDAIDDIYVGIENIQLDETEDTPVYYNLKGQRLNTPPTKGVYIRTTKGKKSHIFIK